MAPVVTAVPPPVHPQIKRPPPPPTIQTNGTSAQPSSSPSMSAKKPPPAGTAARHGQPVNVGGTTVNGAGTGAAAGSGRPAVPRLRRDTPITPSARGLKGGTAPRSAGLGPDKSAILTFEPRPEGLTFFPLIGFRSLISHTL